MSVSRRPPFWSRLWPSVAGGARRRGGDDVDAMAHLLPVGPSHRTDRQATMAAPSGLDQTLLWVLVALLSWGLVMVYSTTVGLLDQPRFEHYGTLQFVVRHALALLIGLAFALLAFQVSMAQWEKASPYLFLLTVLLLFLVLLPFVGKEVNGARRWIPLGLMNLQPSELSKLAVVMYAAGYMVRRMEVKERFWRTVVPMLCSVGLVGGLLLLQPDLGTFIVIAVIAMGILFLGGINARVFFLVAGVLAGLFVVLIMSSSWRRERVFAYLDPFSPEHALGKGYQLSHALIALGRGEWFGVGLGGSVEKLHWLPEAHTDFLLAVIGEELGLVGVWVLMGLFLWLIRRIMLIGRQALALEQWFAGWVAQGIALWLGVQALIHMGVNLGALPTKGLTLPFMSFGGSALLVNLVAMAVVLRIDHESRQLMQGGRP
jgi:cell division protein FtsW